MHRNVTPAPVFALKRARRSGDPAGREAALAALLELAFGPDTDPQAEGAREHLRASEHMHVVWSDENDGWVMRWMPPQHRPQAATRATAPADNVVALRA